AKGANIFFNDPVSAAGNIVLNGGVTITADPPIGVVTGAPAAASRLQAGSVPQAFGTSVTVSRSQEAATVAPGISNSLLPGVSVLDANVATASGRNRALIDQETGTQSTEHLAPDHAAAESVHQQPAIDQLSGVTILPGTLKVYGQAQSTYRPVAAAGNT